MGDFACIKIIKDLVMIIINDDDETTTNSLGNTYFRSISHKQSVHFRN